jgi:hypothetical protein
LVSRSTSRAGRRPAVRGDPRVGVGPSSTLSAVPATGLAAQWPGRRSICYPGHGAWPADGAVRNVGPGRPLPCLCRARVPELQAARRWARHSTTLSARAQVPSARLLAWTVLFAGFRIPRKVPLSGSGQAGRRPGQLAGPICPQQPAHYGHDSDPKCNLNLKCTEVTATAGLRRRMPGAPLRRLLFRWYASYWLNWEPCLCRWSLT